MIGGNAHITKASVGADIIGSGSALGFDLGLNAEPDRAPFELSFLLHFERLEKNSRPSIQVEIVGMGARTPSTDYTLKNDSPFSSPAFHLDDNFGGSSISLEIKNGDIPFRMTGLIVDFEDADGRLIRRNFTPVASAIPTPPTITLAIAFVCGFVFVSAHSRWRVRAVQCSRVE
jgi:hypothetical protein